MTHLLDPVAQTNGGTAPWPVKDVVQDADFFASRVLPALRHEIERSPALRLTSSEHPFEGKRHDLIVAARARRHGVRKPLTILQEARAAGINYSLAIALVEQETGFRHVFGHDPTRSIPDSWKGGRVTWRRYRHYKRNRKLGLGMQGVAECQLTWWQTQDAADALGGCHKARINMRVGFRTLHANIRAYGYAEGIARYNGTGPAARAYSERVRARAHHWHGVVTK